MARVITFSKYFQKGHPKAGLPTLFVDKIHSSLGMNKVQLIEEYGQLPFPKRHTIRAGSRFKVGDKFSPRIWTGKPYASKQEVIAPDIEVKKVFAFEKTEEGYFLDGKPLTKEEAKEVAFNDGLLLPDFNNWFKAKAFKGQVICWDETVNY